MTNTKEVNMNKGDDNFPGDGHISDDAAALTADAIIHGQISTVSEQILTHVEHCTECKDKIIDVVMILRNPDLEKDIVINTEKNRRKSIFFYPVRIAAIFAVFALMLSAYFFITTHPKVFNSTLSDSQNYETKQQGISNNSNLSINGSNETNNENDPASIQKEMSHEDLASLEEKQASFKVNPNLENMIGSQLRGSAPEALSPLNNETVKCPIRFSWKKELTSPITLEIVNNKNKILYSFSVKGFYFDFNNELPKGLYYWKLVSKNEAVFVGKFFIVQPG